MMATTEGNRTDIYGLILEHLSANREFREMFFRSPQAALHTIGVNLEEEEIRRIEAVDWASKISVDAGFDEKNVLRCSVSY